MFGGLDDLLFYAMTEFVRLQRPNFFFWLGVSLALAYLLCGLSFLIGRGIHIDWKPSWVLATLLTLVLQTRRRQDPPAMAGTVPTGYGLEPGHVRAAVLGGPEAE